MAPLTELDPRAKWMLPLCLLLLVAFSIYRLSRPATDGPLVEFSGRTMGTTFSVKVAVDSITDEKRADTARAIHRSLERVNGLMSTYDRDSELSRFNRHRDPTPFAVSAETLQVFQAAAEVAASSNGAFDVTVAPLVDLWGFGPSGGPERVPDEADLAAVLAHVGPSMVQVHEDTCALSKTEPDTTADLSALAKGFAVDQVAHALADLGYTDFLVEVGGELKARGRKRDGSAWRVAVEAPDPETRRAQRLLALQDHAVATSGDYRNFYQENGRRISHIIDPRTGRPVEHRLAAVSVLHEDAMMADAWATALLVLGQVEGAEVAEESQLAACFTMRDEEGNFLVKTTRMWDQITTPRSPSE